MVAATGVLAPPTAAPAAAAAAAACPASTGVTAFVDFAELGGGVTGGCDRDGGGKAAVEVFRDAGYTLEYSQQPGMNGYVCKVQRKPSDRDCAASDSFWSLWWSDGESGRWVFASRGVGSLEVPDGGYVAWAWHEGAGRAEPPAVVPTAHPDPEPTDDGDDSDDGGGGGESGDGDDVDDTGASSSPTTTTTTASATTSTGAEDLGAGMPKGDRSRSSEDSGATSDSSSSTLPGAAEITAGPPPSGDLATDSSGNDGSALPTWIGIGLAAVVLGTAGVVTVVRRRTG